MACPFLQRKYPSSTAIEQLGCLSKANPVHEWGCAVDAKRCDGGKDAAGNTYADCPFYKNGIK